MAWSQANRPFRIKSPLGEDVLLLVSWEGEESVSSLFHFKVVVASPRSDIKPVDLLLKAVTLELEIDPGSYRTIHGVVRRFARGGTSTTGYTSYLLEITPPHWVLTQDSSFDIYQNKTAREVCDSLLTGVPHEWKMVRTLDPRPYCFRYRESRWACMSRLLEQEGVWYRFDHKGGEAKLVLGDNSTSAPEAWGVKEMLYDPNASGLSFQTPRLFDLNTETVPHLAKTLVRTATEFLPSNNLLGETGSALSVSTPPAEMEWYEYDQQVASHHSGFGHGGAETAADVSKFQPDIKQYSRLGQERSEAGAQLVIGRSRYVGLESGAKTKIAGSVDNYVLNQFVFITKVQHSGSNGSYETDGPTGTYENAFEAIPYNIHYRPPRTTPWPRVAGSHVGTVVGPAGEEIFTDKHGRVQVVFKWDVGNSTKLERSCWVRVSQPFAGQGFGAVFLPRIGHEVIVDFLDGNPDNPVIVGSLYNSANLPPWKLPDNKTQSGVRTHSTLNGGSDNYNELQFEDKKGSELINVQAEKDLHTLVKNDERRTVNHDRTTTIKNDETKSVTEGNELTTIEKGTQTIVVKDNNRSLEVGKDHTIKVKGNEAFTVDGNRDGTVKGNQSHAISGNDEVTVTGKQTISITGNESITIEQGDQSLQVKLGNISTKADLGNIATKADVGNIETKASLGKITLEALQMIELKVGPNSIQISPAGVTIKGIMVKVEGTAMAQVKAPMTQVNGDGMLMMKGGITMIN
ncbi:MAG TPA: type VI secretion system tip protein TssI/VgrG [Gemmatimonas sp.]|uniref:type VI secretion system Vgr family protein n=1 Tax=Gemmatimonas sp. TaxID=1962908 RepID=UPI002ED9563B